MVYYHVFFAGVVKERKMRMGRTRVRLSEEGREWRVTGFLYADDLALYGQLEQDLRVVIRCFIEECKNE